MIVIFEGPDGAGKSTMIQAVTEIATNDGIPVGTMASSGRWEYEDPWREYVARIPCFSPASDVLYLLDRWHLGELVYGPIFRGRSRLSMEQRAWIEGYMKTLGAVMIHLTASDDELVRRLTERGDDMVSPDHIPAILAGYARLTSDGHQPRLFCRTYDTTGQRIEPTASAIYHLAKMEVGIAPSFRTDRPYWEVHPWPS